MSLNSNNVTLISGNAEITQLPGLKVEEAPRAYSRRRHPRFKFLRTADWDFFTAAMGVKAGYIEDISQGGCLLRTTEPIEHRRWIRLVIKEESENLYFTCVGRAIRRENRMEAWDDRHVTLYRYGIEFIHELNPVVLEHIQKIHSVCATCGEPTASIPDLNKKDHYYCVLCHLRQACHNLLVQDGFETA